MWIGLVGLVLYLFVLTLVVRAIRAGRMSRRRLVALVSAMVLFTLGLAAVAGVFLLIGTEGGRERFRGVLQPFIAGKVKGGTIYIGRLSGSFLNNITVDSLAIRDKRGELLVSTGRATFTYNPRDFIDQRVNITRADIAHPYVHLTRHETGKWNFQEIFSPGPQTTPVVPEIKTRGFGDYIVIDSVRTRDGSFTVTMPWHPDDTLHGAKRDSTINEHLTNPAKAVTKTFDGFGRNFVWTNVNGLIAHARLADPDSDKKSGQEFRIADLSADEFEPTFKFRRVADRSAMRNS